MSKKVTSTQAQHSGRVSKPAVLKLGHDLTRFDCGKDQITGWLQKRARQAADNDTAQTFVICRGSKRVIGYHSLAAGAAAHASVSSAIRQNTPDPIPVIVLARLGVHQGEQGNGLGQDLLTDALKRAVKAARIVGARGLLIHALDAEAAKFYEDRGFKRLKANEDITYFMSMKTIRENLT